MKKQIIILIVCLVIAGALGASLWFLMGYEPEAGGESSAPASTAVQLVEKTSDELDTVAVQNETGSFVIKNLGGGDYGIEGIEGVELNRSSIQSAANCGYSLRADALVSEAPENLGDFGLDKPAATLEAKFVDGSSFALELGALAPTGSYYYCKKPGESAVYTVSEYNVRNLLNAKLDFVSRTVTEAPATASSQDGQVVPEKVTLGGSLRPEEIVIQKTPETDDETQKYSMTVLEMIAPRKRGIDADHGIEPLTGLLGITADAVAAYRPDSAQLAEYGLSEPYSTIRFSWLDGEEQTQSAALAASAKDAEGNVYLQREGVPLVYRIAAASLPWYEMEYQDFISSLQLLPYIDSVKTVTLVIEGKEQVFALDGESDDLTVMSGGKALDTEQFRTFYQNLIGIPSEEYTADEPPAQDTAILRVTYEYRDAAKPADTLALLPGRQARKVFLSVNGEAEFYTKSAYIDTIKRNQEKLNAGEKVGPLY